jgi:hypothetical protein
MALIVTTWRWGTKYADHYVGRLKRGVASHLETPHRFQLIEPPDSDRLLFKGCLVRLKMFSPEWQAEHGIAEGDIIVNLDLDLIVTRWLDPVFARSEDFVIFAGANAANPCPFNGSVMMLRAGKHREVWDDFSLDKVYQIARYEFPDDQGWIWHKLPNAATWQVGPSSGIYAFRKPQWPRGDQLPDDARMVAFPGHRDPAMFFGALPWIQEHWR